MTQARLTPEIIRAAAQDAGNRSMRQAGRAAWSDDDWNAACAVYDSLGRLIPDQQERDLQELKAARHG